MKFTSGQKDVRAYGRARSPAARATLDYLRGFYLARLRLVKTRRQKDVRAYGKAGSLAVSP